MPSNDQLKLIHIAARAAGLISDIGEERYRTLLGHYKDSKGCKIKSSKDLNNYQIDDLLAICEALGWRAPGKDQDFYRLKAAQNSEGYASYAQQSAIEHLAGDLGWGKDHLGGFLMRMSHGWAENVAALTTAQAYKVIEGMKSILCRGIGKENMPLNQLKEEMERTRDGQEITSQV